MLTTAAGATTKYFLHRDHLSSIRLVTNASGNVVEQTAYAAYGEPTNTAMQTAKSYIGETTIPKSAACISTPDTWTQALAASS